MAKRHKMTKKASRKSFRKGAMSVKSKNYKTGPLRGGIRL